jgi:hypothetical protein
VCTHQNDHEAGKAPIDIRDEIWKNDGTGHSYEPFPARSRDFVAEDECPTDLLERWQMHCVSDCLDDLAAAALRLSNSHDIPRKPCAIERGHPRSARYDVGSPVLSRLGGKPV